MLSPFEDAEKPVMERVLDKASEAVILILRRGISQAMNEFNPLDLSAEPEEETNEPNR